VADVFRRVTKKVGEREQSRRGLFVLYRRGVEKLRKAMPWQTYTDREKERLDWRGDFETHAPENFVSQKKSARDNYVGVRSSLGEVVRRAPRVSVVRG